MDIYTLKPWQANWFCDHCKTCHFMQLCCCTCSKNTSHHGQYSPTTTKNLPALEFEGQNQLKTSSAIFYIVPEELSLIHQHLQEQHTPTHGLAHWAQSRQQHPATAPRQHSANSPDQLWHTLDVGDLGGERRRHGCLLLWQWYPCVSHFQSLKSMGVRRWRDIPPTLHSYFCFTSFASSVFYNWSSSILWPASSHFPHPFPCLDLKYFFCSFNPIYLVNTILWTTLYAVSHTGVCAYLSY